MIYYHFHMMYRLSGILHVLYSAITECINRSTVREVGESSEETCTSEFMFTHLISKETAEMAVRLTEYFQLQRKVYEEVRTINIIMTFMIVSGIETMRFLNR